MYGTQDLFIKKSHSAEPFQAHIDDHKAAQLSRKSDFQTADLTHKSQSADIVNPAPAFEVLN